MIGVVRAHDVYVTDGSPSRNLVVHVPYAPDVVIGCSCDGDDVPPGGPAGTIIILVNSCCVLAVTTRLFVYYDDETTSPACDLPTKSHNL
jgi:hypothetical protein